MVYIAVAGIIFLMDSVIKFLVEHLGEENKRVPIFKGRMYLTKYHNRGAFLDFGENRSMAVRYVSAILTAGCLLVFLVTLGSCGKRFLKLGLSMMLGGAFSNTCDRMTRHYVVDYIGFASKWKKFSNVVYNISDFFIMTGAVMAVLADGGNRQREEITCPSDKNAPEFRES
nr:signal peptidase II [Lachnospiraceae bacterium]